MSIKSDRRKATSGTGASEIIEPVRAYYSLSEDVSAVNIVGSPRVNCIRLGVRNRSFKINSYDIPEASVAEFHMASKSRVQDASGVYTMASYVAAEYEANKAYLTDLFTQAGITVDAKAVNRHFVVLENPDDLPRALDVLGWPDDVKSMVREKAEAVKTAYPVALETLKEKLEPFSGMLDVIRGGRFNLSVAVRDANPTPPGA